MDGHVQALLIGMLVWLAFGLAMAILNAVDHFFHRYEWIGFKLFFLLFLFGGFVFGATGRLWRFVAPDIDYSR